MRYYLHDTLVEPSLREILRDQVNAKYLELEDLKVNRNDPIGSLIYNSYKRLIDADTEHLRELCDALEE